MTKLYLIAICGKETVAYSMVIDHLDALKYEDRIIKAFDKWAKKNQGECVGVEMSYSNEKHKVRRISITSTNGKFTFKK